MAKLRQVADQLNLSTIATTNRLLLAEQRKTNELLELLLRSQMPKGK